MARIESLSILASPTGNDYLAEKYGAIIENVETKTISAILKNTELSGDPTTGTVEAKRFVNATAQAYGTARAGGAGNKLKAKPIIVAIDDDLELIEEVEEKDTRLYGVDGLVERRLRNHEQRMIKSLEKKFFSVAAGDCEVFTTSETTIDGKVNDLIAKIQNTKNEFVDGVDKDMIAIVMDTATYSSFHSFLDKSTSNPNVNTSAKEFNTYHGVRIEESTDLPEGVNMIGMVYGAVAQPVLPTLSPAEKIPFSNAYGFGIFFSKGTKAVMPDLIYTYTDGALVATASEIASGKFDITVATELFSGSKIYAKTASAVTLPAVGTDIALASGFAELTALTGVAGTATHKLGICEVVNGKVARVLASTITLA